MSMYNVHVKTNLLDRGIYLNTNIILCCKDYIKSIDCSIYLTQMLFYVVRTIFIHEL